MVVLFWPRQEVLQLVIQQLANSGGKILSNDLVVAVLKQLSKQQTPEGTISFDRWLIVAKEFLRWNDSCLKLFWEMLLLALSYSEETETENDYDNMGGVDLSFLAVFLVLHTSDLPCRSNSPGSHYDTGWPDPDTTLLSPPSLPLSSPSKIHNLATKFQPNLAPPSPKSPTSSPRSSNSPLLPTSPKRANIMSPRQSKSASHYLYSVRQKLPLILRAITIDDSNGGEAGGGGGGETQSEGCYCSHVYMNTLCSNM